MPPESPFFLPCADEQLAAILHRPDDVQGPTGVLLVVGGPQYRVGSHRQFVLLARALAAAGIPVLRFDFRGMGDSGGAARDFEQVGDDIRAALDAFVGHMPMIRGVVLWGLCDAAAANAFYANTDARVVGQIALNPWARTEAGEAQAFLKHYYLQRLLSGAFWRKVVSMRFDLAGSVSDLWRKLARSRAAGNVAQVDGRPLPVRLRESQLAFGGRTLLILSGRDLTAREYEMRVAESPAWQQWMQSPRVEVRRLEEADHTFSSAAWRDQVAQWTLDWIRRLPG